MNHAIAGNKARQKALPLFLLLFTAIAFKAPDALSRPQFWAEDSVIFFQEQFSHSLPQLFVTYAGYLHTIPRLVAWLASFASPLRAPLIYNFAAILMSAAALTFVMGRLRATLPVPLMLATFLLLPTSGEVLGTVTNVQWFLQFALVVACFTASPDSRECRPWLRDISLFLVAITGPFSLIVILVALALHIASWADRRFRVGSFQGHLAELTARTDPRTFIVIALGAIIQLVVLLTQKAVPVRESYGLLNLLHVCFTDLIPIHVFGSDFLTGNSWTVIYFAIVAALVFGKGLRGDQRLLLLAILLFAVSATFIGLIKAPNVSEIYDFRIGDRYFVATKTVFWWAAFGAIASVTPHPRREISAMLMVCIALVALTNMDYMRRAPLQDFAWKAHARELQTPGAHVIPVNPQGWSVNLTSPPSAGQ